MADLTPVLNDVLQRNSCKPIEKAAFSVEHLNEFLKEAYQINSRISEFITYLRSIRQPYLSNAPPPHRSTRRKSPTASTTKSRDHLYLNDSQRDQIDAEAKAVLRDLHDAVRSLAQVEQARQEAEAAINARRHRKNAFGALGSWAAGGAVTSKSPEEEQEAAQANGVKIHREGVVWLLQRKLEYCGSTQSQMMEIRLRRDLEKSSSVLYKSKGYGGSYAAKDASSLTSDFPPPIAASNATSTTGLSIEDLNSADSSGPQLSEEQMQLFAKENQDMLKLYESKLDQVKTAEKSLVEISELQSTLVSNLEIQSSHIDQLVQDSFYVAENVGKGNKELKKASERRSTARLVFYSTCALCTFLVAWDLII